MKSLLSYLAPNRSTVTPFASKKVGDLLVATDGVLSGRDDGADISGKEADDTSDNLPLLKQSLSGDTAALASDEKAVDGAKTSFWKSSHVQGLGFIVFSSLNFSIASACIKYDSRYISSHESMFWRISINLVINYIWLRRDHVDLAIRAKERGILLFRCFVGALGTSLSFYAMANMVLTDATVIIFTSPIATFLFGAAFLNEPIERIDFACALVSYVGVIFVARPAFLFSTDDDESSDGDSQPLAVIAALGAAISNAIVFACMRKLHDIHPLAMTHYFLLFSTLFSVVSLWIFHVEFIFPTDGWAIFALIATAIFSSVGQFFMTLGFQREQAGIASVMRYFDVVFVLILDVAILHEDVSWYSILGGAIIISGAVLIVLRSARTK